MRGIFGDDRALVLPPSWALLGVTAAAPGASGPLVINRTITAGNLLVLILSRNAANETFTGVTDDGGNAWVLGAAAPSSGTTGRRIEIWHCAAALAATQVQAAMAAGTTGYATLLEWTPGQFVAAAAAVAASATAPPAVALPTAVPRGGLIIGAVMANPNTVAATTVEGGWARVPRLPNGGHSVAFLTHRDPGEGPAWTLAAAAGSGQAVAVFRP